MQCQMHALSDCTAIIAAAATAAVTATAAAAV
jgi:hypothetical protein